MHVSFFYEHVKQYIDFIMLKADLNFLMKNSIRMLYYIKITLLAHERRLSDLYGKIQAESSYDLDKMLSLNILTQFIFESW